MEGIYQVYVKIFNGQHKALNFSTPSIPILSIKARIQQITGLPIDDQRLVTGTRQLDDSSVLQHDGSDGSNRCHPVVHLLLRLPGGKGGFGSLLRGAATKAGQKKTNNFDACRDMSGRRLRHVNAEKRLEEWRAEAEERQLEKIAEEFIKKNAKKASKAGGNGDAEKYVEKYRKEAARCMEEVEKSVREAIGNSVKRKATSHGPSGLDSKRTKIWMGKRNLADSDSDSDDMDEDDSDDDEEEETEKSVVLDSGNNSDSKEAEGSSGSVANGKLDGEDSTGNSSETSDEKDSAIIANSLPSESCDGGFVSGHNIDAGEPASEILEESRLQDRGLSISMEAVFETEDSKAEKQESSGTEPGNVKETIIHSSISGSVEGEAFGCGTTDAEKKLDSNAQSIVHEENVVGSSDASDIVRPLNFDDFNSAAELEALGLERLKSELQSRGLKCGGTLQERAARLFLLKTTPLERLPKKLLAKK
ncbi:uncharacterized protein LOC127787376 [Diospyros lotus]|uniref:uncharacterized protein LOC127787376 n=1 Tax=Diospyros lotus TaxID=55363 RepID=UPI0022584A68|nr:uncharacterized protein LOC127787376 [Diospyros lotus]